MKTLCAAGVLLTALGLTACSGSPAPTATPDDGYVAAWNTCLAAYAELPHSLDVLEQQTGKPATKITPCENWIDSQGRDGFIKFWSDPDNYMRYVIDEAALQALSH